MQIRADFVGIEDVLVEAAQRGAALALAAHRERGASLLDVDGAADFLATSAPAVRALVRRRRIPFIKLPTGGIRFDRSALEEWARSEVAA